MNAKEIQELHNTLKRALTCFSILVPDDKIISTKLTKYVDIVDSLLADNIVQAAQDMDMLIKSMVYTVSTSVAQGHNVQGSRFESFSSPLLSKAMKMDISPDESIVLFERIIEVIQNAK